MKHALRYHIDATAKGEIAYDPKTPASYAEALNKVAAIHKAMEATATVTRYDMKPVVVRE